MFIILNFVDCLICFSKNILYKNICVLTNVCVYVLIDILTKLYVFCINKLLFTTYSNVAYS